MKVLEEEDKILIIDTKRDKRIHHRRRIIKKRLKITKRYGTYTKRPPGFFNKHNLCCSCHMCRNPRTSKLYREGDKLTIQERKLESISSILKDEIDDNF